MYVVIVDFVTKPEHATDFARAVSENAKASLAEEPACHQFDVCVCPDEPFRFFLYEIYTDRAGFDAHLASAHFKSFDRLVGPWVAEKKVRLLERIES
jgi:autoinducer 2-degrading protein